MITQNKPRRTECYTFMECERVLINSLYQPSIVMTKIIHIMSHNQRFCAGLVTVCVISCYAYWNSQLSWNHLPAFIHADLYFHSNTFLHLSVLSGANSIMVCVMQIHYSNSWKDLLEREHLKESLFIFVHLQEMNKYKNQDVFNILMKKKKNQQCVLFNGKYP